VGPTAGLEAAAKLKKFYNCPRRESNTGCRACSLVTILTD